MRLGVGWKRAKTWITSPDPAYLRKKGARDRLIRLAERHPDWVLGFQDEVWWSRLARPGLHAWAGGEPLRLHEPPADAADRDPKALACYGLLRGDTGGMLLRFVAGPPGQPGDRGLPGLGLRPAGGRGEAGAAADLGQRLLARQRPGPGLDQGAQPPGEGRGRACGSWPATCR